MFGKLFDHFSGLRPGITQLTVLDYPLRPIKGKLLHPVLVFVSSNFRALAFNFTVVALGGEAVSCECC